MRNPAILASALLLAANPAGQVLAASAVGVTAAVNQSALGTAPGGGVRTIALGQNVVFNERIATNEAGLVQILLADGTAFTVGPRSEIVIDSFVYDPQAGTARVAASLTKGVFRFVGGRTSKTAGGVSLQTRAGTIGIRGAVVDINLGDACAGSGELCGQPFHADMIFGDGVTLTDEGGKVLGKVYEPGYSIVVDGGAVSVKKTPPEWRSAIQTALSGKPGSTGGSPNSPTNQTVADSGVPGSNSEQPPESNAPPPVPQPRPNVEPDLFDVSDVNSDAVRHEVSEQPPPPPPPPPPTLAVRILTAGDTYGGFDVSPGDSGLVGGSSSTDQSVTLSLSGGSGTGSMQQGAVVLPVYNSATSQVLPVTAGQANSPFGPLSGQVHVGPGDFAAYVLAVNGDPTQPFYAVAGTAAPDPVFQGTDIRVYNLSEDPIQGLPVPFMRADATGLTYSGANATPLYVLESDTAVDPRWLQVWLSIEGTGADQVSAVGVSANGIFDEGDGNEINSGRRGSFRDDALAAPHLMRGGVSTVTSPSGGHFFGPNAENFVLMHDVSITDYFNDSPADMSGGTPFGTLHVATLSDERPLAAFDAEAGRVLGELTEEFHGFAAGVVEGWDTIAGERVLLDPRPYLSNSDASGVTMDFVGASHTLGAAIQVVEMVEGDAIPETLNAAFGFGVNGNDLGGGSAYVHDDLFAAIQNNNKQRNTIGTAGGQTLRQADGVNPAGYLVSADALPQTGFVPAGASICACKFLEWGWWGTEVRAVHGDAPTEEVRRASVHLGTWVAGDITDAADMPASGTATYEGHAVGNVISAGAQYVAGGAMTMTWNFSGRDGTIDITDFDGRDLSGTVADPNSGSSFFRGELSVVSDPFSSGSVSGAFVNNGADRAAGVIGNFGASAEGWAATGIIAGERGAITP